ncbi:hypothetical protein GQ54DRAFT_295806 [Martensiomyces pterosporus]|nr:hypothetical protein GQ54DRAFT_295806 [Martensiomyces pterosporus]
MQSQVRIVAIRALLLGLLAALLSAASVSASAYKGDRVVLGYFPVQRVLGDIPWDSLTHANIAFAYADEDGSISFKGYVVNSTTTSEQNAMSLIAQGQKNGVKMLVAVGGQGNFSNHLGAALNTSSTRSVFVSNAADFIQKYNLDGIDIDWEYPANMDEAQSLLSALQDTRKALNDKFGIGNKLLTMTLYNHPYLGPNLPTVDYTPYAEAVDYGFMMAYDYFGSWADASAPNSPFIDVPFYPGSFRNTTDAWLDAGWPANKLIAGLAFYGHSSIVATDMSKNTTNQYVPIPSHKSVDGPVSHIEGTWTWKDLRDPDLGGLSAPRTAQKGWVRAWDNLTMTPWLYRKSDSLYIGYDDQDSLGIKLDYTLRKQLAGVMIWEIGYDYNNELLSYVRDFIKQVDSGTVPKNCAPSDSQLDNMYRISRNPNFFNRRSLIWDTRKSSSTNQSPPICQFGRDTQSDSSSAAASYPLSLAAALGAAALVLLQSAI